MNSSETFINRSLSFSSETEEVVQPQASAQAQADNEKEYTQIPPPESVNLNKPQEPDASSQNEGELRKKEGNHNPSNPIHVFYPLYEAEFSIVYYNQGNLIHCESRLNLGVSTKSKMFQFYTWCLKIIISLISLLPI